LLAEAGHTRGFEARLAYIADRYRGMEGVVAALAAQLGAVGIQVRPQPLSLGGFRRAVSEAGEGELFLVSWLISTGDAAAAFNVLVHSPQGGTGRYSGYSDPEMDRLLERSFHPMPHGDRLEILRAAAEKVHAEVAAIPLYRQHDLWLVSDRLAFTPRPDRRIRVFEMALR
ncbi:MAG TPA: hypothetical protein VFM29_00895, partial [Vicinamibacteria bacterium]|nr:hypothetical protein [Vicinamibacteria bacterium]